MIKPIITFFVTRKVSIAASVAVASIVSLCGWYVLSSAYDKGKEACERAAIVAYQEAQAKARVEIVKKVDEHAKIQTQILSKGDTGYGVGERTRDALNVLRQRAAD